jgi:hypothetical protein
MQIKDLADPADPGDPGDPADLADVDVDPVAREGPAGADVDPADVDPVDAVVPVDRIRPRTCTRT